MIRKSKESDIGNVQELMCLCFGDHNGAEPYENITDRYYLYFDGDNLVAMSGVTSNSEYGHLEIDWTCTHPEYRHKGYIQALFKEMLNDVHEDVYCSCWRVSNKNKANLYTIMSLFGFEEVIPGRVHWKTPHTCFCNYKGECVYYTDIDCECYEDLFLRKGNKI